MLRRTLGTISGIGLGGISGNFKTVAYSPDGKTLAAGYGDGGDGGVVLFDARGERLDRPLEVKEGSVTSVAFGPVEGMIAAGMIAAGYGVSGGGGVVLFDARGKRRPTRWRSRRAQNQN